MARNSIVDIRALVLDPELVEERTRRSDHWIQGPIAAPLGKYEQFQASRASFGKDILGKTLIELETADGTLGWGLTNGGVPTAWLVERYFAPLLLGETVGETERAYDILRRGSLHLGGRGIVAQAIGGIDLAHWDAWGRSQAEPVHALLGGACRESLLCYATGLQPERALSEGFVAAKVPLERHDVPGGDWIGAEVKRLGELREIVGGRGLMLDCWMSLDLEEATRLVTDTREIEFDWLEDLLAPDDYDGYSVLTKLTDDGVAIAAGEHGFGTAEYTALANAGVEILQPDISWSGGLSALLEVDDLVHERGLRLIPHAAGPYVFPWGATRTNEEVVECIYTPDPNGSPQPIMTPWLLGEPIPKNGRVVIDDRPGFGMERNPDLDIFSVSTLFGMQRPMSTSKRQITTEKEDK